MGLYTLQNAERATDDRGRERRDVTVWQVRDGSRRELVVVKERPDGGVFVRVKVADIQLDVEGTRAR